MPSGRGKDSPPPSTEEPPSKKLPDKLQQLIHESDRDDRFFDRIVEGHGPDSTDSKLRYAAYATRLRTLLTSAHRYIAYTSDIGESFRPVAHPIAVRAAYAISWLYVVGDVAHETYRAYVRRPPPSSAVAPPPPLSLDDYRVVAVRRAIFQSLASIALPAVTIHSVVRYSGLAARRLPNVALRTWGPVGLGLAVVPFLPAMFDHPVEEAVDRVFRGGFRVWHQVSAKEKEL